MKIAIIGSGISGLSAAYFLHDKLDITLYEKNSQIGGHSRTLNIDYDNQKIAVDTGFIVFNPLNYPHLTNFFKHLQIKTEKSNMSFGITINQGQIEWSAQNIFSLFGQISNLLRPSFYKMIFDINKFFINAPKILNDERNINLEQFLDELKLGTSFRNWFLLPMAAAIWSCPTQLMLKFPAKTFIRFFENHGLLTVNQQPQWYTVNNGSQEYVNKIKSLFADKILTNCKVLKIKRLNNQVEIIDSLNQSKIYDKVIIASHADEALSMLEDPTLDEKEILSVFKYQENIAYLHRDLSLMPKRKRCWASWVYLTNKQDDETKLAVTYWMNNLQNIAKNKPLFVTLNPAIEPKKELTFDRHIFTHPIFTQETILAQEKIDKIQGQNNTYYCGAHLRYGFHEDGILSAVNVVKKLKITIPWE